MQTTSTALEGTSSNLLSELRALPAAAWILFFGSFLNKFGGRIWTQLGAGPDLRAGPGAETPRAESGAALGRLRRAHRARRRHHFVGSENKQSIPVRGHGCSAETNGSPVRAE